MAWLSIVHLAFEAGWFGFFGSFVGASKPEPAGMFDNLVGRATQYRSTKQ